MKKTFLTSLLVITCIALSFAQENNAPNKKLGFSAGVELAAPTGYLKRNSNVGIGGSLQGEYMTSDKLGITLNAGYIHFSGKKVDGYQVGATNQIPILAGARYYFIKDIYLSGQLGMSVFAYKGYDTQTAFTYAPGIGIKVSLIDATLKYMAAPREGLTLSNVNLRVAVSF